MIAAPIMLSLITLLSQSITPLLSLKSTLTLRSTKKNVIPIMGIMAITHKANFQLIVISNILAPIIKNKDEIIETIACEIKSLIESTSAVRLVNNLDGLAC